VGALKLAIEKINQRITYTFFNFYRGYNSPFQEKIMSPRDRYTGDDDDNKILDAIDTQDWLNGRAAEEDERSREEDD